MTSSARTRDFVICEKKSSSKLGTTQIVVTGRILYRNVWKIYVPLDSWSGLCTYSYVTTEYRIFLFCIPVYVNVRCLSLCLLTYIKIT